ncbi:MAG: hypothetical protein Q7S12_02990 [bacterium]|nr:hypothetical protein [bacterium]
MNNSGATFASLIDAAKGVLCSIIPALFILATVVFLYGVVKYVVAGGDEKKMDSGKQFMIYGLIGLFVMVAMWGIVNAAVSTFFGGGGGGNAC